MKTNFHNKNFALNLAFIMRFTATLKWPIELLGRKISLVVRRCFYPGYARTVILFQFYSFFFNSWVINILSEVLVSSIAVYFYSLYSDELAQLTKLIQLGTNQNIR